MPKIKIGILCGGQSAEHEVSLQSARCILEALNPNKYDVTCILISKNGDWYHLVSNEILLQHKDPSKELQLEYDKLSRVIIKSGCGADSIVLEDVFNENNGKISHTPLRLNVVFPVLHGPLGEDGTVQGMLALAGIPFVGSGVLGSAVGMDKDVMKRLLREAGIPIGRFATIRKSDVFPEYEKFVENFGSVLFVKPANMGSSVGVSRIENKKEFLDALELAFLYDAKVIIEEAIVGREIEVAVLGNSAPEASLPGELVVHHEFYSYEAKYLDKNGASAQIPADLDINVVVELQELAVRTFKCLEAKGLARVDFFVTKKGEIFVNEINTLPGFTSISMYPKMWEASGLAYSDLLDKIVLLGLEDCLNVI
jgi:D-alanine-D-alanine ligase